MILREEDFMNLMITAVAAFLFDALIGDPPGKFHPVVIMGNFISRLEKILRRDGDGEITKVVKGGLLVTIVLFSVYAVGLAMVLAVNSFHSLTVKIFVESIILSFMIAPRSLAEAGRRIYNLLISENIVGARREVGMIVGRDTDYLNEAEITRATVETISENTVDGIISPLFYFAVGGLPLAMVYRAANTMDSMLGYKNEKYLYFGKVAARFDDVANFIPARITGLIFIISAFVLNYDYRNSFEIMKRDAAKHPSPNGGWAEATVAGALRIQLGGINSYFGIPHFRAYMGDPIVTLNPYHITAAIRMMYTATIIFLCLILIL